MSDLRRLIAPARVLRTRLLTLRSGVLCATLCLAALWVTLTAPVLCAPNITARFIQPDSDDILVGQTEIILQVNAPEGVRILKVEVWADDRLIFTLLDPPWRRTWDAGDSIRSRRMRLKAWASDGSTATQEVLTRAIVGAQRAVVDLVEVYATVRDEQGKFLTDLKKDDFTVEEAGKPQNIAVFSADRKPVHLALLMDTSNSMNREGRLLIAQEAAAGFLKELEPEDTASLIAFSDVPRVVMEGTSDKEKLEKAVLSLEATGGTALYDAIMAAIDELRGYEGRKAIILLSDGRDEAVSGLEPGSVTTFEQAVDAVLESETTVYAIGTGEMKDEMDFHRQRTVGTILDTLATRSGGRAYFIKRASKLDDAYGQIEDELRHHYTLAYYAPNTDEAKADRKGRVWRPITVKVTRPRAKIAAREGYYAR